MKKEITTEEKILHCGRLLFSKSGYVATSMSDIAKEVGITKASLYYFFKNKQALYIHILLDLVDHVSDVYDFNPEDNPQVNLESTILKTIEISKEYGSMLQNIDPSKFDTNAPEFKIILDKQQEMDKEVQIFLKKCGVVDTRISSHILNSATHGYIQRLLFGINDIKPKEYANYISTLLVN